MKKTVLSLAVAGSMIILASACNSTKNATETRDSTSTTTDSTIKTTDTSKKVIDTTKTTPPDTTKKM